MIEVVQDIQDRTGRYNETVGTNLMLSDCRSQSLL